MRIEIFGPGCAKCHETEKLARAALDESGLDAEVVKVTDFKEMAARGVFATPAVAVDGALKCTGRVPAKKELLAWFGK